MMLLANERKRAHYLIYRLWVLISESLNVEAEAGLPDRYLISSGITKWELQYIFV